MIAIFIGTLQDNPEGITIKTAKGFLKIQFTIFNFFFYQNAKILPIFIWFLFDKIVIYKTVRVS